MEIAKVCRTKVDFFREKLAALLISLTDEWQDDQMILQTNAASTAKEWLYGNMSRRCSQVTHTRTSEVWI